MMIILFYNNLVNSTYPKVILSTQLYDFFIVDMFPQIPILQGVLPFRKSAKQAEPLVPYISSLLLLFSCYQYNRLHVRRVPIIDVGVQGNISMVLERFRGSGKHIHGFEVLGNISTSFSSMTSLFHLGCMTLVFSKGY